MKESTCNDGKESGGEDGGLHGGMWICVMRRQRRHVLFIRDKENVQNIILMALLYLCDHVMYY